MSCEEEIYLARMKYLSKIPFDDLGPEQKSEFIKYKRKTDGASWSPRGPVAERTVPADESVENVCARYPRATIRSAQQSVHSMASILCSVPSNCVFTPMLSRASGDLFNVIQITFWCLTPCPCP